MNKTYGVNMADKHLVVGSIEVLGDMSGSGIKTIQQKITAIEQKQAFTPASVDYWSELISDGVITPIEKKTIKQQFEEINSIHSQLEQQAALQDKTSEEVWINYDDTFYALQNYLYTTLKLFDDMTVSSPVADRDLFNEYFSTYYSNQSAAQILLTQGEPGRVRNLTNLNEYGTDGEVAVYRNWFYIYNAKTAKWTAVPNTEFLGPLNVEPSNCTKNQYFLASETFKASKMVIGINRKPIAILNKIFKVPFNFTKGNIYVWKGSTWEEDSDRNSYRYLVATNDIITQGGEISPNLQNAITSVSGTTGYLGMFASDPENVPFNSYYVYIGSNTGTRENGTIYIYKHEGWKALDPNNPDTYSYYMKVLKDCLGSTDVQAGAFSSLFANTLAANTAFITALFTEQLTLLQNGFIQSQGYKPGTGFRIQADGHAEFNDITLGASVKTPLAGTATNVSGGSIADMTTGGSTDTSIALHSGNWSKPNSANGFGILKNGDAYFNNGKFRGDLVAKSLAVENEITVGENFKLDKNGKITATDVDISGKIKATSGEFEGDIIAENAIFKNGIRNYHLKFEGKLSQLISHINLPTVNATYNANGFFYIHKAASAWWKASLSLSFQILSLIKGNNFVIINGVSSSQSIYWDLRLAGIDPYYQIVGNIQLSDPSLKTLSLIWDGNKWYYYDGLNVNIDSYNTTAVLPDDADLTMYIVY